MFLGFVGYSKANATILMGFRGSQSLANFIADYDFLKVDYPGCPGTQMHSTPS